MSLAEQCKSYKERHTLIDVANRLCVDIKRDGKNFRMREDNSVVFFLKGEEWRWHDKGDPDKGGDQIDFIQWRLGIGDIVSALQKGHELFGEPFTCIQQGGGNRRRKPISRVDWCRRIATSRSLPCPDLLEEFPLLQIPLFKHNPDSNYWGLGLPVSGAEQYRRVDGKLFKDGSKTKRIKGTINRPIGLDSINPKTERVHFVEGEGDALAVWTLLHERFDCDLSRQSIIVFCGADVRLRFWEIAELVKYPVTIWAQNDLPGLELAIDSYQKLVIKGCDPVVMIPSTDQADWGDYYSKHKFLPLQYDRDWVEAFGWENLLHWARVRKETANAREQELLKVHRKNGSKGGRPPNPKRADVRRLIQGDPSLGVTQLCQRVGMEPNAKNKRNVQRWIKPLRGTTKPSSDYWEMRGCDKTPINPSGPANQVPLKAVGC